MSPIILSVQTEFLAIDLSDTSNQMGIGDHVRFKGVFYRRAGSPVSARLTEVA
jgi:hypothetical protein